MKTKNFSIRSLKLFIVTLVCASVITISGCTGNASKDRRVAGTVGGAALGGIVGHAIGGSTAGTVIGGAVGAGVGSTLAD